MQSCAVLRNRYFGLRWTMKKAIPTKRHFQLRSLTTITKTSTAASILSGLISMPIFFREQWATKFPEWELMENPFNGEERFCATSRKELTVEIFVTEYPHLLAYLCRRAVLENAPFELTRETIKHYGFSREDVKLLRDCIASNNRRIIDELREEYERLKAIDCLQVVPPKRRGRKPKAEVSAEIQPIAKKPRTRISRKKFVPTRSVKS